MYLIGAYLKNQNKSNFIKIRLYGKIVSWIEYFIPRNLEKNYFFLGLTRKINTIIGTYSFLSNT